MVLHILNRFFLKNNINDYLIIKLFAVFFDVSQD